MKRIFSIITAVAMIATMFVCFAVTGSAEEVWDGVIPTANDDYAFSGGSGTKDDPYLISTAADLAQLSANVNEFNEYAGKYFKFTADIVLNKDYKNYKTWDTNPPANNWVCIGLNNNYDVNSVFKGTIYGDGHVIKGMYSQNPHTEGGWSAAVGLFGCLCGEVYDLGIEYSVAYSNPEVERVATGVFAAYIGNCVHPEVAGKLSRCYVANSMAVACGEVGLFGGFVTGNVEISDCYATGTVKAPGTRARNSGIAGEIYAGDAMYTIIKNCYSFVDIITNVEDMSHQIAGVAESGGDDNVQITNCYFDSTKCSSTQKAAIYGKLLNADGSINTELVDVTDLAGAKGTVKNMKLSSNIWVDGANGPVLKAFANNGSAATADIMSVCLITASVAAVACIFVSKKRR